MNKKNLLFIFSVPAPYIIARLNAVNKLNKFNVHVIFMSNISSTYSWNMGTNYSNLNIKFIVENTKILKFNKIYLILNLFYLIYINKSKFIFISGYSSSYNLFSILFSIILRKKIFLMSASSENDFKRFAIRELLKKLILCFFSGAIVGGEKQKKYLIKLGLNKEKVVLGYNTIDTNFFYETKNDYIPSLLSNIPDKFFLVVSRLVPKKNIHNILLAYTLYKKINKKNYPMIIAGDGPLLNSLKSLSIKLNIDKDIYFIGFIQQNELKYLYHKSICIILFSITEQWGLVINEAIACSKNVIVSSACGCADDLVEHGINGFIVDPYNYIGLAKYMMLINNNYLDTEASFQIKNITNALYSTETFSYGIELLVDNN